MDRVLIIAAAIVAALVTWWGLVYLARYSGVAVLQSLTFWISPIAVTGWILCLVLIAVYYWVFAAIWRSLRAGGGA